MRNKTISDIRRFHKPLRIFTFSADRKKRIVIIVICAVLWSVFTIVPSHADTWIDDFDEEVLNGWKRIVEVLPYFAEWSLFKENPVVAGDDVGRLGVTISKQHAEHLTAADFLRWNAHQFQLDKLVVVGEEIGYTRVNPDVSGELGLFLGKRLPDPDFAEGYMFSPEKTTEMRCSAKGVFERGETKADYERMFRLTSENIRVVFDAGKFQLWTQDLLVTEFVDEDITKIDAVGLMAVFEPPGGFFSGRISTFSISGSGIPQYYLLDEQLREVQLRERQLTTTWGKLKRF